MANLFHWYSSVWFFDMIMHFLGGVWVGFGLLWLFVPKVFNFKVVFQILFGVILVGLAWEVFEFLVNENIAKNPFDLKDTTSDLFFDTLGGLVAVWYFFKKTIYSKFSQFS